MIKTGSHIRHDVDPALLVRALGMRCEPAVAGRFEWIEMSFVHECNVDMHWSVTWCVCVHPGQRP